MDPFFDVRVDGGAITKIIGCRKIFRNLGTNKLRNDASNKDIRTQSKTIKEKYAENMLHGLSIQ